MTYLNRLDAALVAAGIPFDGVTSEGLVWFKDTATPAQKTQAAAIVASIDPSQAADLTYQAQQAKTAAQVSIDIGALQNGGPTDRLVRALALVVLDEVNILRTAASLAPRTAAQLITAIKAKIAATAE